MGDLPADGWLGREGREGDRLDERIGIDRASILITIGCQFKSWVGLWGHSLAGQRTAMTSVIPVDGYRGG